jgi:hypothetical protein
MRLPLFHLASYSIHPSTVAPLLLSVVWSYLFGMERWGLIWWLLKFKVLCPVQISTNQYKWGPLVTNGGYYYYSCLRKP